MRKQTDFLAVLKPATIVCPSTELYWQSISAGADGQGDMEIDEKLKANIARICKRNRIRIMAVFGSSLQGTGRDIDLALYPHRGGGRPEIVDKLRLIAELETLFGRKVDIVVVNPGTSTTLLFEICRNSLLLYEDQADSFENERSVAFRKYADTFKFRRMREKTVTNFVKELDIVS